MKFETMARAWSLQNVLAVVLAILACYWALFERPQNANIINRFSGRSDTPRPMYYIPTKTVSHLVHLMGAFERAGYDLMRNNNYTNNWHIMWSFHNPFYQRETEADLPALVRSLNATQKVNHFPGASHFTSKVELAKEANKFDFMPKSFVMPDDHEEFLQYHKGKPNGSTWVRKGAKHRGVQVVDPFDPALKSSEEEFFVQEFVQPYLIDGRMWDLGFYVAITSVNPLRAYFFDNLLLRFCSMPFEEDLENAERESYVIEDDYVPPWGMESLRKYFVWGLSTANVLRAHFATEDVDLENLLDGVKASVVKLLLNFEERLDMSALRYPHGRKSFFSMYRLDFLIDKNFKPWLVEVNQSPNLSSAHTKDLANMFERIAYSLVSLNGFFPGGINHPYTTESDMELISHTNDVDIAYDICIQCKEDCTASEKCLLCRRCRTPSQSRMIKELISEHRNRQGFIRLFPPSKALEEKLGGLQGEGPNNRLMREWINIKCRHDFTWC